jgi:hypothetical protein
MLDVHPAHHAASTWREFFIHIATIVLGLLIAVGLEQTVEYVHHRSEAREARKNIQQEIAGNLTILQRNQQQLSAEQQQFAKDFDLLNSGAPDAEILHNLEFGWYLTRSRDAAWSAAKIDGSLALIPPREIHDASYYYESIAELTPTFFAYFTDIDTAGALLDHARTAGKLTASERQQLLSLTASAMGHERLIYLISSYEIRALQSNTLQ